MRSVALPVLLLSASVGFAACTRPAVQVSPPRAPAAALAPIASPSAAPAATLGPSGKPGCDCVWGKEACCTVREASGALRQGCVPFKEGQEVEQACAAFGAGAAEARADLASCTRTSDCPKGRICATNPDAPGRTTLTSCAESGMYVERCRVDADCGSGMACRRSPDDCTSGAAYCELPRCLPAARRVKCGGVDCTDAAPICCVGGAFGRGRCATQAACEAASANVNACLGPSDCGKGRTCCSWQAESPPPTPSGTTCMLTCFHNEMGIACRADKDCLFDVEPHCRPATYAGAPPGLRTCQP